MGLIGSIARHVASGLPDEGRALKRSVRRILVHQAIAVQRLGGLLSGVALPDPRTVFRLDPARIVHATCCDNGKPDWEGWVLPQTGRLRMVRDGDWDCIARRVDEMRVHAAVRARVLDGASWRSTEYYRSAVRHIEAGHHLWNCRGAADFDAHCTRLDRLIESIARDGYRDSRDIGDAARIDSPLGQSEVLVNLGRDGVPLFQDGRHRLAIAQVLGIRTIPVQVFVRHAGWVALRDAVASVARMSGDSVPGPAPHFDLVDVVDGHDGDALWRAIAPCLPAPPARALVVDGGLGWLAHRLQDAGFDTVGVERRPELADAARRIADGAGRSFAVACGDVFADIAVGGGFAVVVAPELASRCATDASRAGTALRRLQARTLFCLDVAGGGAASDAAVAGLRAAGGFARAERVGVADDGRAILCLR